MKDYEKILKKIKTILEKREDTNKKLEDSFLLNSYINDCINVENETRAIKLMMDSMNKNNQIPDKRFFFPKEINRN